jgi:hypothetical protein
MSRAKSFLDKAYSYKEEYNKCKWWMFLKKRDLHKSWISALDLAVKFDRYE